MSASEEFQDMTPDEIHEIRELARNTTLADRNLDTPPPSIWAGIEAELGLDTASSAPAPMADVPDTAVDTITAPVAHTPSAPAPADTASGATGSGGVVVPLFGRRVPAWALGAAAATVAAVGLAGFFISSDDSSSTELEVATVEIVNDELPVVDDATGSARLLQTDDGYVLDVDVENLDTADGYLELWVIDPNVEGMHSLGRVDGDGRFSLPDGVDPADFPIVDISVEQEDGVATHSGQSVLRGALDIS